MIIFYDKKGTIVGTIDGRIHPEEHLNMWIGEDTQRIICNWVKNDSGEYEPELPEFVELEKDSTRLADYKVVKGKLTRNKRSVVK